MEKLLTISVAAYNVEKFLDKAVLSCLCNNKEYLEVIVVNDGSQDLTADIAKKYEREYPGIVKCVSKQNGGYGSTINVALQYAKGKYFKLMDGDDWYDTDELEILMEKLSVADEDMIITDYTEVYENSNQKKYYTFDSMEKNKTYLLKDICNELSLAMHAVMFKTDILKQNNISITEKCFYTDVEFLLAPIAFVETVKYLDLNIYQYRLSVAGQSVSLAGMRKHCRDASIVLEKMFKYLPCFKDMDPRKEFLEKQLAVSADFQLRAYLCLKPDKDIKAELVEYDINLRDNQPMIYSRMSNIMTDILRKTNYHFYFIYSYYIILKMKLKEFIR